ncbi:PfkB family carbohydrate kinase [Aureimonas sp. AU20]|uniref:PfkB family carbohydrate kinase n=1 Tax=Aureimonas sp. AU20 TaxID=1349819 RepID=UPI000721B5A5|nr:PfkB family carbohydrate kinase [Aureimonas sp. AU20]ALN74808.1 hypothetical protein M673_18970 [Aureimonas sp. AU20]
MAVHVVGNVGLDTTFRLARFPRAGETVNADEAEVALGGKGANQALAALRAGARTTLWAGVGDDAEAGVVRRRLIEDGLCDRGLAVLPLPTDRSTILVESGGENQIVSAVACARRFEAAENGWRTEARAGDVLVLQGNFLAPTTRAVLEGARALGLASVLNASPLVEGEAVPFDLADVLVVNRVEGEMLTSETEPERMIARLLSEGAGTVIVTLGADGVLAQARGEPMPRHWPAPSVCALDTSGAGDVFCGTLAARLSLGEGLGRAVSLAVAASALAVTRPGTFGCGPSPAEFQTLLEREHA